VGLLISELRAEAANERLNSLGVVDWLRHAWYNDRPEFDDEPADVLAQLNQDYLGMGMRRFGPESATRLLFMDRDGGCGFIDYDQDDYDGLWENYLGPLRSASIARFSIDEAIMQMLLNQQPPGTWTSWDGQWHTLNPNESPVDPSAPHKRGASPAPVDEGDDACAPLDKGVTPWPDVANGRVILWDWSVPKLGNPWQCPQQLSFSEAMQVYNPPTWASADWGATVLAASPATEPDDTPQGMARSMLDAFPDSFYDQYVTISDVIEKPVMISGMEGWRIDAHINYSVPGVDATYDKFICVSIRIDPTKIIYVVTSVPNTLTSIQAEAEDWLAGLSVP